MFSQAPVNGKTQSNGKPQATGSAAPATTVDDMTTQVSSLASDLITLAELQAKLLFVDMREAGSKSAATVVSLGAMGVLGLGAGTVMLTGCAELLAEFAHWNRGAASLVVGGVALSIAGFAGWLSVGRIKRVSAVFTRSHQELHANLEFIKSLVEGSNGSLSSAQYKPDRRVRV